MSALIFAIAGSVMGVLTVGLGAFGAHALKSVLDEYGQSIWEKAVLYQAIHVLLLLLLPTFMDVIPSKDLIIIGSLIIAGVLLFSGSLYILALSRKKYFGAITPLGGITLMVGWSWLAWALLKATLQS